MLRNATSPKGRGFGISVHFHLQTINAGPCGLDSWHRTCESGQQGPVFYVIRNTVQFPQTCPVCQWLPLWGSWTRSGLRGLRSGSMKKALNPKIESFFHDPYGNRTHVTAVKGPCLNRLTNGPYKYRASLKPPTSIIHYCGRPSPIS